MIDVSIIVPVYNALPYLQQCLDSIVAQTHESIEVICVDDGSSDGSMELLEEYASNDQRFTVLRQSHAYAGAARNAGMDASKGEYLVFWDADDYFRPDAIELMLRQIKQDDADICVCAASRYYQRLEREVPVDAYIMDSRLPESIPFSSKTNPEYILNFTNEAAWNKMFRKQFIINQEIRFQHVRNGNDLFFVSCAMCLASSITIVHEHLIIYRTMQESSLVGTIARSPLTPFQSWIDVRVELEKRDSLPEDSYIRKTASVVFYLLANIREWESMKTAILFLQGGGLDQLLLRNLKPEEFYLSKWNRAGLEHLANDTPEEFVVYLAYRNYDAQRVLIARKAILTNQRNRLKERNQKLRRQIKELKRETESLQASNAQTAVSAKKPTPWKRLFNGGNQA